MKFNIPRIGRFLGGLAVMLFVASVILDLLHAKQFNHGFYWSEAILFELKWLLFIPGYLLVQRILQLRIHEKVSSPSIFMVLTFGVLLSLIHLLTLGTLITSINFLLGQAPFRYLLFNLAEDNLLFIFLVYSCLIYLTERVAAEATMTANHNASFPNRLPIVRRGQTIYIQVEEIVLIKSTRGYAVVYMEDGQSHISDQSLKNLEEILDPTSFCRVHRQSLVHIAKVQKSISRGNGDYDLILSNQMTCRLSRRYRGIYRNLAAGPRQSFT